VTWIDFARRHRRFTATLAYAGITVIALALAFLARWEFEPAVLRGSDFWGLLPVLVAVRLGVNIWFRMAMGRWRFVGTRDFLRLLGALTTGSLVFWAFSWSLPFLPNVPRSIVLLEWVFSGYLTGGTWVLYRLAYEGARKGRRGERLRVLVVGAGEAGQQLVHQMQRTGTGYAPVGFVDDDPLKGGTLVHGVEVLGRVEDVARVARARGAEEVVIAIPSATPGELRRIVGACEATDLPLKLLPGIEDVIRGDADLGLVREVQLTDLLGRDPISLELPALAEALEGRTVLVTGAAGSIGSELARQIALHRPRRLVMLDQAETPLYYLDLEVRRLHPDLDAIPVVADVTHQPTVEEVFCRFRPDRVFHAAAYKHVPMMEHNAAEAVRTNVLGTWNAARAAGEHGAGTFILISTDKAVRPANVMGATKNLAEKVVLQLQAGFPATGFGAVRFGNVLGSSGSVIPLFKQQLARGEPLTVTHEEVTRFFITISEAVQLVLQASLVPGIRGRVAMLDMGDPVRILDVARDLLRLSGRPFRPGENVVVTGLRPGEKLHEELAAPDEQITETEVERVFLVEPAATDPLDSPPLRAALDLEDGRVILDWLFETFPHLSARRTRWVEEAAGAPSRS
jgi:FlaA1/EpsC-like NDP-sugar epimerase